MIRHPNYKNATRKLMVIGMLLSGCSLLASPLNAAEIYRWTDAEGVVHMSDKRPEEAQVEVIKPQAPAPRTFAEQAKDQEMKDAQAAAEAQKEANAPAAVDPDASRDLRCQQERERLTILQNNSVVHMQDANGNLKKLNEAQIQQEIAVTQKAIDALCQ